MGTIWLIAAGTFGEATRRRTLLVFLLVALGIILATATIAAFQPHSDTLIIKALGLGVIGFAGAFISIILGINLIPTEIERRTIYTILSKPVHRYQFLCGKFLGGLMTVLASVFAMSFVFLLLFVIKERGFDAEVLAVAKGILLIIFEVMIVTAVAVFFSVFLSPFVNFFLTFAVFLLGNMSSVTAALADPTSDPTHPKSAMVTNTFKVIHAIIPNFAEFNVQNPILDPHMQINNQAQFVELHITYALAFTAILLILGSLIFERREV